MPLNYVTVNFTFDNISGAAAQGFVSIAPTGVVTNAAGQAVVSSATVTATLGGSGTASISIVAMDNTGLTPAAGYWAYNFTVNLNGQSAYTQTLIVNFANGATQAFTALPVAVPATAYGAVSTSSGFTNPMTTLGDLIYENATPAAARLAGDTSNTRKFLRTQASAGVAQAPAWDTIQTGDLPAGVGLQPWQFLPESYGALGNGKVVGDVATTSGSAVITSATANFTSADVGKFVMIHGANGTTSGPLITTILSRQSATQVTLGTAAGATVSNCPMFWGTDDTAAFVSMANAMGAYGVAHDYFAEALITKLYCLASGPTQIGNGSTTPTFNTQIPLPYPAADGTSRKLIIALTGPGDNGFCQFWESLVPNVAQAALVSLVSAPTTPNATFGIQSVIGGPTGSAGLTGGYANTKVVVKGLAVWCPIYTNLYAWDFGYVSAMRVQQSAAHIFAPTGVNGGVLPYLNGISAAAFTSSIGSGFRTPVTNNNADIVMDDVTAEGYECGFRVFDHFNAGRLAAIYSDVAMFFNGTQGASGVSHGIFVQSMCAEVYNVGFLTNGGTAQVNINWDAECTGVTSDITDNTNALHGIFRFRDPADAGRGITVSGAAKLKIVNEELGPGLWASPPSVPATTVAQVNTAYRDATVYLTSGGAAVTVIKVDSTTTGLTLGTSGTVAVRVPAGHSITLTYASTAPTWAWVLE